MIDEKRLIKKLDNRIDTFVKQHPEEKDCLAVQSVREFKQMIEAEVKEQEKGKSLESELLGRLDDMKESKESFCGEQGEKCNLYESCFQCAAAGIVDIIKQLEEEQDYSNADFDEYVREVAPYLGADFDDTFSKGLERAIMVIRAACRDVCGTENAEYYKEWDRSR